MALLGVCVGANQILGGLAAGEQLGPLFAEYNRLRQSSDRETAAPSA
jgi:hypothetical protein